jgi:hypothetical protein
VPTIAMGIGRFAFTPRLPMVLHDGLSRSNRSTGLQKAASFNDDMQAGIRSSIEPLKPYSVFLFV